MKQPDIVVIGGGTAGYAAAIFASQAGAKVTLVEKDALGGTCLNRGCIPTKALFRSAEMLRKMRQAGDFGLEADGVRVNFGKMMARKDAVVRQLVQGVAQLMAAHDINVIRGPGRLLSPGAVKAGDAVVPAGKVIIATGSEPARLSLPGADLPGVMNTDGILGLKELPESLLIIGGGYIGMEMAGIFGALGTQVTVLEALPRCLATVDGEIVNRLLPLLRRQGIGIKTNAGVKSIKKDGGGLRVAWEQPDGEDSLAGQLVLAAAGRRPYTGGLGLEELGVKTERGAVTVNEYLETGLPGVYAIGDVLGRSMLAHVAYYEAEVAVSNALGTPCRADYAVIPKCIFSHPELAAVGLTEQEAKESDKGYTVSRFPFAASGAAVTMQETAGLVKVIADDRSGAVLGVHIIGPHASELIAGAALAIRLGATAADIAGTICAHPTLAEALREAAMGLGGGALHVKRGVK